MFNQCHEPKSLAQQRLVMYGNTCGLFVQKKNPIDVAEIAPGFGRDCDFKNLIFETIRFKRLMFETTHFHFSNDPF
jgi:hypothetical protein